MELKTLLLVVGMTAYTLNAVSQTEIYGKISDAETGEPLTGASVLITGTQKGSSSGYDGSYKLSYAGVYPCSITVSFLGYKTKEHQIPEAGKHDIRLVQDSEILSEAVVTSRRRSEVAQDIPIPISVLSAGQLTNSIAFNVNRVKELVPSVQLYSSNPRNTTLNIRGLGSTFGLTNDGIDPGVGFYVDGVYFARPAATTIDFLDIERIEVLRGPQGTLFGKNTTAGAFNIVSRKPSFAPDNRFEFSFGNYGFLQAKASISGAVYKDKVAARFSFSGTQRDGLIYNQRTQQHINSLNNIGAKGTINIIAGNKSLLTISADYTQQRPNGYAQVFAGSVETKRAAYRQFENIISDLGYDLPSRNPFDRIVDHDTPWRSNQELAGSSMNFEADLGKGTFTSTTAWRYWNWDPSNDRDFTGLEGLRLSQAPSIHNQYSQEFRYAGDFSKWLSGVVGLFALYQDLRPSSGNTEQAGKDQWRFSQNSTSPLWQTEGLLDGFGIRSYPNFESLSSAIFGQFDFELSPRLNLIAGVRLNYDEKSVDFRRETFGGLNTNDPQVLALQNSVYSNQQFEASIDTFNFSGQFTASYEFNKRLKGYGTYALNFKPVGLNLGGIPNINGIPAVELAVIKPEKVTHIEGGIKSTFFNGININLTGYKTIVDDFQTSVQTPDLGVNRGYLANAERVSVTGAEIDISGDVSKALTVAYSLSYTDAVYDKFTNAPPPLEETGGPSFKDISGGRLPGVSRWAMTATLDYDIDGKLNGQSGKYYTGIDLFYRSDFSSSPSPSKYLNINGYHLVSARLGFRADEGLSITIWSRNLLNRNYFEQLLPGAGNAGHYAAVLGDQRTIGITLNYVP